MEENAYFRATIRKAEEEILIDGVTYYGYLGKWRKGELWHTKGLNSWSEMGYEVVLYITKNDATLNYFHRFQKIWIGGKYWEVQFVNDLTNDSLLIIYLKETFINEFEDKEPQPVDDETVAKEEPQIETPVAAPVIEGKDELYPFDKSIYKIKNAVNGRWFVSNTKAQIERQTAEEADVIITSAKSGSVDLIYKRDNEDDVVKTITIKSL